ncbi:MAG: hypothetical protein WBC04_23195 [Candidatus Acidiferrales bacterium]
MILLLNSAFGSACPLPADKKPESEGFVMELPAAEPEVLQVVKNVAEDAIVHGTYVYEREKTLTGAIPAESSDFFGPWQEPGHAFYKVLSGALAPRHFKDSSDIGTITVRYVVQPVNEARTRLRIDAVFVEDGRRKAHSSDGTVETSEFKEIQDRLDQLQLDKQKTAAALKRRQEEETKASLLRDRQDEGARLASAESSVRNLEQRLHDLRHDVELRVKNQDTELKSAPFHTAAKLQSLASGAEVVVLIVTPYWYGVETSDGHRGWLRRDQVEPLP